jgi:hypothetical protein
MNRQSLLAGLLAIAAVGAIIAGTLWFTRKNTLAVGGRIVKVRTHAVDADNTIAVLDFRISNQSALLMKVREAEVVLIPANGPEVRGETVSEMDAVRLFDYFKDLGQKYNPSLLINDKIAPGQTIDRMLASSFKVPQSQFENRKAIRLRILDVDGATVELTEGQKP